MFKLMWIKALTVVTSILAIVGFGFGAQQYIEQKYAKENEFQQLKHEFGMYSLTSQWESLRKRIWFLEQQIATMQPGAPGYDAIKQELEDRKAEFQLVEKELDAKARGVKK